MLTNDKIETRVRIIRRIYLTLTLLGSVFSLMSLSSADTPKDSIQFLVATLFYLVIYLGMKGKKSWLIPLVLIAAAFGLFRELLFMLHPADTIKDIIGKIAHLFMFVFFGYQLQFFSKSAVKQVFGSKGVVLFR